MGSAFLSGSIMDTQLHLKPLFTWKMHLLHLHRVKSFMLYSSLTYNVMLVMPLVVIDMIGCVLGLYWHKSSPTLFHMVLDYPDLGLGN